MGFQTQGNCMPKDQSITINSTFALSMSAKPSRPSHYFALFAVQESKVRNERWKVPCKVICFKTSSLGPRDTNIL